MGPGLAFLRGDFEKRDLDEIAKQPCGELQKDAPAIS